MRWSILEGFMRWALDKTGRTMRLCLLIIVIGGVVMAWRYQSTLLSPAHRVGGSL